VNLVPVRLRSGLALTAAFAVGVVAFGWPFLTQPGSALDISHSGDAPLIFVVVLPLLAAVVLAELTAGGVGPWLPFQMIAAGWVGFFAGSLPPARGRVEVAWLTSYAVVVGLAYGLVMNLWFWPFASYGPETSYAAGDSFASNLSRYLLFYVTTSLPWDLGRSVLAGLVLLLAGSALLRALRRASRRAAFDAVATFEPGGS
jgi:energy-coupling factor transport system substrate-specific component